MDEVFRQLLYYISHRGSKYNHDEFRHLVESCGENIWKGFEGQWELLREASLRGRLDAVKLLLDRGAVSRINHQGEDGKTALHEAAYNGHDLVAKELINRRALVDLHDANKQTALHRTVYRPKFPAFKGHFHTAELLIMKKAHTDRKDIHGRLPLHYAALNCHEDILRLLLDTKDPKVFFSDDEGNTPLHLAASKGHFSVANILFERYPLQVDVTNDEGQTPLCLAVNGSEDPRKSKFAQFDATVKLLLLQGASIFQKIGDQSILDWAGESRANEIANMIMQKAYQSRHAVPGTPPSFKIPKPPNNELANHACNNSFVKVTAFSSPDTGPFGAYSGPLEVKVFDMLYGKGLERVRMKTGIEEPSFTWYHLPANNLEWVEHLHSRLSAELPGDPTRQHPELPKVWFKDRRLFGRHHSRFIRPQCLDRPSLNGRRVVTNFFLSMPYISLETHQRRLRYSKMIELKDQAQDPHATSPGDFSSLATSCDQLGYELEKSHYRLTLDQYYYQHLENTSQRDESQVMLRAAQLEGKGDWTRRQYLPDELCGLLEDARDGPILMVDQAWIWIFGGDTVISSFPQSWDLEATDVVDSILPKLNDPNKYPVLSAPDLAVTIAKYCGMIHETQGYSLFDVYNGEITKKMNRQVDLFKQFIRDSDTLKNSNAPKKLNPALANLSSIQQEVVDLAELNDVRDELNILSLIFDDQIHVIEKFLEKTKKTFHYDKKRPFPIMRLEKKQLHFLSVLEENREEMRKMRRDADKARDAFQNLLDLKQKQANITEARFARQRADDTAKQGDTVLVFTVVTIVFLPASFMAAFFAVPNVKIPGVSVGGIGFVIGIIVGMTILVSGPLMLVAFNIEKAREWAETNFKGDATDEAKEEQNVEDSGAHMKVATQSAEPQNYHSENWKGNGKNGVLASGSIV